MDNTPASPGRPAVPSPASIAEDIRREHADLPAAAVEPLARAEHLRRKGLYPAARQALAELPAGLDAHPRVLRDRIRLHMAAEEYEQAVAALQAQARIAPDDPWLWYTLASAHQRLGRRSEEIAAVVRALALQPQEAPARRLFEVQRDSGDVAGALDTVLLLRRLRDTPELAVAQARLLARLDRPQEALALAESLLALDPLPTGAVEAWVGLQLATPGGADRVLARAREELARRGGQAAFLAAESRALHRMDRTAEAVAPMQQAAAADPGNRSWWYDLAVQQRQIGQIDESQQSLERAMALDPLEPATLRVHGVEHRYVYGDAAWRRIGHALAQLERYPKERQVELHFAAAKAYEDVGELDAAFEHYRAGGAKQQELTPYRHAASVALMRTLRQGMMPRTYAGFEPARCPSDKPVFVLGMPRSGTTLVEQIMASHPEVHGAGELKLLHRVLDGIAINRTLIQTRQDQGPLGTYLPGIDLDCTDLGFAERGERYVAGISTLAALAGHGDARRVVDKMPGNYMWTGMIPLILPNARIVHTRRHPMDCCLSNYRIFFPDGMSWSYDLRTLGKCWRAYQEHMRHWESNLPAGTMLSVHYEAVVADIDTMARRIIAHIGLAWDDACLRFYDGARPVKTASLTQVRRPIYNSSVGRWARYRTWLKPLIDELGPAVREYEDGLADAMRHLAAADGASGAGAHGRPADTPMVAA